MPTRVAALSRSAAPSQAGTTSPEPAVSTTLIESPVSTRVFPPPSALGFCRCFSCWHFSRRRRSHARNRDSHGPTSDDAEFRLPVASRTS